jgi:hypothetical protein
LVNPLDGYRDWILAYDDLPYLDRKAGCPVSKLLNAKITLDATLL